jgi:hypothetical protein
LAGPNQKNKGDSVVMMVVFVVVMVVVFAVVMVVVFVVVVVGVGW